MAFLKTIFMLLMMMAVCGVVSMAAVYEVGESAGWTSIGGVDYQNWAANKNFHAGDTLVFNFNNQFHNVKQVRPQDFKSCNATSPIATYTNGSDWVTLDKVGHFYFICGFPGHCEAGQKVEVMVTPSSPSASPSVCPYGFSPSMSAASNSLNFASIIHLALMVLSCIVI